MRKPLVDKLNNSLLNVGLMESRVEHTKHMSETYGKEWTHTLEIREKALERLKSRFNKILIKIPRYEN